MFKDREPDVGQLFWGQYRLSPHTIEYLYSGTRLRNELSDCVYSSSLRTHAHRSEGNLV